MDGTNVAQACVWENGSVRALPSVTGTPESAAWAINDVGTIVGHVYTPMPVNGPFREAVIWQGATVAKLTPPTAGARTFARAIDNFGRVAISWTTQEEWSWEWYPSRWTPDVPNGTTGTMTTLGFWGASYDINDSGVVSGSEGSYGYLWDGTTPTELASPYWGNVKVYGVNNSGVAAGSSEDTDSYITTALVWDTGMYGRDLNLLLTATTQNGYPGSLVEGLGINASGQILVSTSTGIYVVLTPSSDPVAPYLPAPPSYVWTSPSVGSVDLYWPAPYFATSYNVKRSTVSGGPYTTIATGVPWNSFTDTSLVNGTTYYYVVSSVNGGYESADSPEASATPVQPLPEPPSSVSATAGDRIANLTWTAAYGATSYNVKRATVSGGPYTTIAAGVTSTGFTDPSVANGTRYYYVVSSVGGSYESANSAEASALPLAPPVAPTNLRATVTNGNKSVKLAWTQSASPGIQLNAVYRSTNGGSYVLLAQFSAGTSYTDTSVKRNMTYSYVVTAVNVNGASSPFSNSATARTKN
jgi:fibronectin type 3 domain-containing protein